MVTTKQLLLLLNLLLLLLIYRGTVCRTYLVSQFVSVVVDAIMMMQRSSDRKRTMDRLLAGEFCHRKKARD